MALIMNNFRSVFFIFSLFLFSCTTTQNLVNSEKIYIGMSIRSLCEVGIDALTAIADDPCYGIREYDESSSSLIIYPSNKSVFFVFRNINSKNSNRGSLSLITYSYSEAIFYRETLPR